jgi:hypothetical protein
MDDVKILGVEVVIDGNHLSTEIDFGALTLSRDGREYIVDGVQSYRDFNNGETTISIDVKVDREVFCDCKYDLKETDLFASDLSATFFFSCDEEWESGTLFVKIGNLTKAIDLTLD